MTDQEITIKENRMTSVDRSTVENAILALVQRPDIDPDRLEKFLDLQVKMEARQAKKSYFSALSLFQSESPIVKKVKKVNFKAKSGGVTKYDYAPLDEIVYSIKPFLSKYGLSFTFNTKPFEGSLYCLITSITHCDGHTETYDHYFNPIHDDTRMNSAQRRKSALSFAKRAGLENALGIVTAGEDDDARRTEEQKESQPQKQNNLIQAFMGLGVGLTDILKFCQADSVNNITTTQIDELRVIYSEVRNGEKAVSDYFKDEV